MSKKLKNEHTSFNARHPNDRILIKTNHFMNLINYMSHPFTGSVFHDPQFLGFMPVKDDQWGWGIDVDGTNFVAVHLFKTIPGFHWGDDERDTISLSNSKPWVLMYYGSDNSSAFMRFKSKEKAGLFLEQQDVVDRNHKDMMYFNS